MHTTYSVYLGKEQQNGFTGFHSEKNFFCVVEIFDGYSLEQGEDLMSALAQAGSAAFDSLVGFDAAISSALRRHNFPLDTSVAVGYFNNDVLYLKTVGSGEVYIHRGRATERILFGNTMASGKCKKNDTYIFTTSFFTQSLKGVQRLKNCFSSHHTLEEYPDYIKSQINNEDDTGAVALIVRTDDTVPATPVAYPDDGFGRPTFVRSAKLKFSFIPVKRPVITTILVLCVGILLWNIASGFVMRKEDVTTQNFDKVSALISEMEAAKEDIPKALDLASQAKAELKLAKKSESVDELAARIQSLEDEILVREKKEPSLFYDLSIENKNAKGSKVTVSGEMAYIFDETGNVYILSLEKKSLEKRSYTKSFSKNAVVAGYEEKVYVLDPIIGIIEFTKGNKNKVVIKPDDAWKDVGGMHIYNGNIYILEREYGDIYKYLVFSEGFGDKASYFKGLYDIIENTSTFAIDSSVYVSNSSGITKYTSGLKDAIEFDFPQDNVTITKVLAHTNEDELIVWDKSQGVVFMFTKEGGYQKQVIHEQLKKAADIELFNKQLIILTGKTISKIDL